MSLVFLLYALFASVFTISKVALESVSPFFLIGARMTFAGILMLAFKRGVFSWKTLLNPKILALAFLNIYLTNVAEYWGLQYLTSFKTCFIYSLSPFLSALFSYLLLSEKLSFKKWAGLFIGFLGFIPILLSQSSQEELSGELFLISFAEVSVIVAATASVVGWIILGKLMKEDAMHPAIANGSSMLIGGILALIHSGFTEKWNPVPVTNMEIFIASALALTVISNLFAYNLYGYLLKRYSATFLSFAGFSTPLFTLLFGFFFLGEVASSSFYLSLSIVFVGLFLFHQEELHLQKTPTISHLVS